MFFQRNIGISSIATLVLKNALNFLLFVFILTGLNYNLIFCPKFGENYFALMLKSVIEKTLQAKMAAHLDSDEHTKENKRKGKVRKKLKSPLGPFDIGTLNTKKEALIRNWSKSGKPF